MVEQRKYVMDIPGFTDDSNTQIGKFCEQMFNLVGFKPGMKTGFYGDDITSILKINDILGRYLSMVSMDSLNEFEKLLNDYNLEYQKNNATYELCCEKSTKESQNILLYNAKGESLLFIASPTKLLTAKAIAYVQGFTKDDERLQRAIIQKSIDVRNNSVDYHGPNMELTFFSSKKEAKESIDSKVISRLKERIEKQTFNERKYDGAIVRDKNNKVIYRYPIDLNDEVIKSGNVVGVEMLLANIVKVYPDGTALVSEQSLENIPMENYFNDKIGIKNFGVGLCESCHNSLKQKVKEKVIKAIQKDKYLTGKIAKKIGYNFDMDRINIRIINKKPIEIYSKMD